MQPLDMLLEMKSGHTASEWSALFQQNPIPDKGVILGKQDFRYWQYEDPPVCKFILCAMDTAFTQGKDSDPSAYQVWGVFDQPGTTASGKEIYVENIILLEGDAQKLTFPALCEKVKEIYQVHQPDAFVVEDRGSGISLIQELRMQGYPVHAFKSDKDKQTRLYACTPYFEAKRVWLPKNKYWAEELVEEVSQFPYGAHDDRVDCCSSAILFLRDMGMLDPSRNISAIGWADDEMDEDERKYKKSLKAKTYWGAIVDRIRA
jgi:predicted phage terminase large subunit-like protein